MSQENPAIFVGREKELELFQDFISTPCSGVRVLSVSGPGGSGKTCLLNEMARVCNREGVNHLFLDFYDTQNRFWEGLVQNVVRALGEEHFPRFRIALGEYDTVKLRNTEQAEQLWHAVEEQFVEEARKLVVNKPRPTVALLDTYEVLFAVRSNLWEEALRVLRSVGNIVIVLAGRQVIESPERFGKVIERYEEIKLRWFKEAETAEYFAKRCPEEDLKASPEIVKEITDRIFGLSEGRPILVAVATDWVVKLRLNIPDQLTEDKFEEFLMEFISQNIQEDLHRLTVYVSHLYRRFDQEVLERIQVGKDPIDLHRSVEDALDELGQYAFIKYRQELGRSCLLHDDWRALMVKYFWDEQDRKDDGFFRKGLSQTVVKGYYDWKIPQVKDLREQQALQAERLYYQLHANFDQAIDEFKQTFEEALVEFKLRFSDLLLNEANAFGNDFPGALTPSLAAELQLYRARVRFWQNALDETIVLCNELLETDGTRDPKFRADVLTQRGSAKRELGYLEGAVEDFGKALVLCIDLDDKAAIRNVYNYGLGLTHRFLGNWDEAVRYYKASLVISKDRGDRREMARTLNNLGNVLRLKGRLASAIDYSETSLAISRELNLDREVGLALNTLGQVYRDQRTLDKAEENLKQAIAIFDQIEDRRMQGRSLANLGHVYQRRGKEHSEHAEELLLQSVRIAEGEGDHAGLTYALNKLGRVHRDRAEWAKAESYFKQSLELAEKHNDWYRVQDNLTDLCVLFARSDQFEKMDEYAAKARELTEQYGYKLWAGRLEDALGDAALKRGNLHEGFEHYAEACHHYSEFDRNRYGEAIEKVKQVLLGLLPKDRAGAIKVVRDYWTRYGLNETHAGMPEMLDRVEDISD